MPNIPFVWRYLIQKSSNLVLIFHCNALQCNALLRMMYWMIYSKMNIQTRKIVWCILCWGFNQLEYDIVWALNRRHGNQKPPMHLLLWLHLRPDYSSLVAISMQMSNWIFAATIARYVKVLRYCDRLEHFFLSHC